MTTLLKEWLIQNEYSVEKLNAGGKYGNSALMKASREGNISLVNELLSLRMLSNEEIAFKFQEDRHAYVNSAYEWDYYVSTLFESAGVLDKKNGIVMSVNENGQKTECIFVDGKQIK